MTSNFYAIKKGYDLNKGQDVFDKIVYTWTDCYNLIKDAKGVEYQGFSNIQEATKYLNGGNYTDLKVKKKKEKGTNIFSEIALVYCTSGQTQVRKLIQQLSDDDKTEYILKLLELLTRK